MTLKGQSQGNSDFEALYLVKELKSRPNVTTKLVCKKLPFVTLIAGVKQSAKVHGPLVHFRISQNMLFSPSPMAVMVNTS